MELQRRFFMPPQQSFFLFGPLDRPEEIDGAALEGLIAQHLRAWLAYGGLDAKISYWRTRSGVEVE